MFRKTVKIQYRRFFRQEESGGATFEALIRRAMDTVPNDATSKLKDRYKLRIHKRSDDSVLTNIYSDNGDLLFGDITQITQDEMQSLLDSSDGDAAYADIEQYEKPKDREFIRSLLYWMIKEDHFFVIQSHSLRADSAEEYFNWIVNVRGKVSKDDCPVVLVAKFDPEAAGGDLDDIQEIIVGSKVAHQPGEQALGIDPREKEEIRSISRGAQTGKSKALQVLAALFGDTAEVDKIIDEIPEGSSLSVDVHIGYRTKKKKADRQVLKNVEVGLRHLPDHQLQVLGKEGRRSSDGKIRLHHMASVKCVMVGEGENERSTGRLDHNDVLRAMIEAYTVFKNNGKISDSAEKD